MTWQEFKEDVAFTFRTATFFWVVILSLLFWPTDAEWARLPHQALQYLDEDAYPTRP